jgi:integrase
MACIAKRRGVWVVDYRDALGRRHRETVEGNRDDANKRLAEILKGEGRVIETKRTLKEYAEGWLSTYAKTHLKSSTFAEYEAVLKKHVYPALGSLPFTKVSRESIKRLIADKVKAGLSRSTVRNIIAPLREMYNHAMDDGVASFNPAARVGRFNRRRGEDKKIDPLTKSEVSILLKNAKERCRIIILFCYVPSGQECERGS